MNHICCYGEVLWDIFKNKTTVGGAPLNSALRFNSFKNNVNIISAVGNDSYGDKLISFLKNNIYIYLIILLYNPKITTLFIYF